MMLSLGIDIGTTSIKIVLVELNHEIGKESILAKTKYEIVASKAQRHQSDIIRDAHPTYMEQDVVKICTALANCMEELKREVGNECMAKIERISVCGQMHGCVLWNSSSTGNNSFYECSSLITWRDQRCDDAFLQTLPTPERSTPLSTGFGCPTLYWINKNSVEVINNYNCSGTIMDYIVASLCKLQKPVMSTQNAMSWGYYDFCEMKWNTEILKHIGFPTHLLPDIVQASKKCGGIYQEWFGINIGTSVLAALGDMQCSILSCNPDLLDGVFNLSTSAQFSTISPLDLGMKSYYTEEKYERQMKIPQSVVCVPYFGDYCIWTAASLNGGAVFKLLVDELLQWTKQFSPSVTEVEIYEKLGASDIGARVEMNDSNMQIKPTVFGERHSPGTKASITNIGAGDLNFSNISKELARSILKNVLEMYESGGKTRSTKKLSRIWACGTAFSLNNLFQVALKESFPQANVIFDKAMDAALGAAIVPKFQTS